MADSSEASDPIAFLTSDQSDAIQQVYDDVGVLSVESTPAPSLRVCSQKRTASKKGTTPAAGIATRSPITTRSRLKNQGVPNLPDPSNAGKLPVVTESSDDVQEVAVGGEKADSNTRRSLWNPDMAHTSGEEKGGAFASIISKYTMTFGDKPTPRIPLYRLTPFLRVRNFQTTSHMTEQLKRSFETHCYNEHGAGFHVCPFDENGNELLVTDEDKAKWDVLWRMESEKFDEECSKVPEYQNLVNRKFSTWEGNHRVITWMEVSTSPERTQRMAWHPRVRCVILVPPVHAYKQIEVAMHNLNASSHATVQYDWIQDAERCLQVLSTPLNAYKDMIGDDVYDEFEKSRMKTPANRPWYNENMTSMAAAYILSFAEVIAAKEAHRATEEAEEKRLGKALTAKAKKDLWDAKVKDICNTWYNVVFKYATIVNPQLGPEFLATVRELHNNLAKMEKAKRPVTYSVGVDRVKAFAFAGIHNSLKIELLRAHYSDVIVKNRYHHPVNNDVDKDIRPWLAQWSLWSALELLSQDFSVNIQRAKRIVFHYFVRHEQGRAPASFSLWNKEESEYCMYSDKDNLCRSLASLTKWEIQNCPWWLEQRCDDNEVKFVGDAEEMCWKKLQDGEEPFAATKDKFETLEQGAMLDEAKILEPNKDVDGLVVDTTRTKKLKEAAHDEEEGDTTTPKKKPSETKNPGSGMWMHSYLHFILPADLAGTLSKFVKAIYKPHSCYPGRGSKARGKQSVGVEKPPRKSRKKEVEEVEEETIPEAGGSQLAPTQEVEPAAPEAEPEVLEVEPAEEADEERQRKRPKKRETEVLKLYEGSFRSDIYVPFPQPVVVVKSSLKLIVDALQANKSSAVKGKVVLVEVLKGLCSRINPFRPQGCFINRKETNVAADCLFLDMPSGLKTSSSWGEVPDLNEYPEDDDLPRKLMNLGRVILDDRGCLIILHQGTLRSNQQIADALDANTSNWKHLASYDVNSDVPQFEPVRNMKVFHSKADIFCKSGHTFNIPKLDLAPFDLDNSRRDVAMISNYNTFVPKKLDDGGRRKCVGFVQTLLENYTMLGDIVIDFAGGWGATLSAAFNCSRCCIALETRKEALESMNLTVQRIEKKIQSLNSASDKPTSSRPSDPTPSSTKARGKRPLGEEDNLGDDLFGDDESGGFGDNLGPFHASGRHTSAPRYEDIFRALRSQPMNYSLPVYAAEAAQRMADMPITPKEIGFDNRLLSNKRRNPFVDDQAKEDHEMAVNLSSDEE
ncbi:hypothetical protein R1sor_007218 [Riccia sorocarpa]|uniref:Trimethylguanosine synthase n=1 Tax=Riccia sorocarpa TaxID=122646 RepID=A0ABD3HTB4_9MARC